MKAKWVILIVILLILLLAVYRAYQLKQLWDKSIITFDFVGLDVGRINLLGTTKITTKIDFYFDNKTNTKVSVKDFNFKAYYKGNLVVESIEDFNTSKVLIAKNKITKIPTQIVIYMNKDNIKLLLSVLAGNKEYLQTETRFSLLGIRIPYKYDYLLNKEDF